LSDSDKLLARLAALETELSQYRAQRAAAKEPVDHTKELQRQLLQDPVGTMQRMGLPVDHMTRVLVANALGDQAPPELKVLAQMGPQVSATNALASDLQAMRQRMEELEAERKATAVRASFKAQAQDKQKYPHLAKAVSADASLFEDDIARGVTAEELESRLARVAKAVAPAASTEYAEIPQDPSTQVQAQEGEVSVDPTPPPIPQKPRGLFTPEEHEALKGEILRKYSPRT